MSDDEMRQVFIRRMTQAAQREADLRVLAQENVTTRCDNCGKSIPADEALSNGGWCDACSYGEGDVE